MCWNIEGLLGKMLDPDFVEYITSFDICCLCETFTSNLFDFNIHFKDFLVFHCPAVKFTRKGRASGGVILLIKNSLADYVQCIDTHIESVLCVRFSKSLFQSEKDVLFFGVYNHPVDSRFYIDKDYPCTLAMLEQFILTQLEESDDFHCIVGGDLNARIGEWGLSTDVDSSVVRKDETVYERKSKDSTINGFGKLLIEFCTVFNMTPLNGLCQQHFDGDFTFYSDRGNSAIDFFLCSIEIIDYVQLCNVVDRVESHHMPIAMKMKCTDSSEIEPEQKIEFTERIRWDPDKLRDFNDFMALDSSNALLSEMTKEVDHDIESSLTNFTNLLTEAGDCMRKTSRTGGSTRPFCRWYDAECRHLKRDANRALSSYKRSRKEKDPISHEQRKRDYTIKRSLYQTKIREKKKVYREKVYASLLRSKNDSNRFWNIVRDSRKKMSKIPSIPIELWKDHFENILSQQSVRNQEIPDTSQENVGADTCVQELDEEITDIEIKSAIRSLKSGKASGPDELPPEFFKAAEAKILPYLTKLFNKIYNSSYFPIGWSRSVIVPLHKKGDKNNPGNYRGISLLNIASKIFTSILNKRLTKWVESEGKVCEEQAGFRKGYSTVDHVYTLMSMISNCLNGKRKSKLYVAFIDYQKAFDTVDRDKLWVILQKINTSTKMLNMLKGIYSSVQACVRSGAKLSDFFDCPAGVKQGCLLSPLIFSLLITEVADVVTRKGKHGYQFLPGLREIFLLLFADDIALISSTPSGLQNQIRNLQQASDSLGLTVNLQKTKIMIFRKGGYLSKYEKWYYKGKEIEVVNSYKYLGFTLTTKLSIDISLTEFAGRAKNKVIDIMKTMYSLGNMDLSIFFKLFDAQVKPLILYLSEIWGLTRWKAIEGIHLFACKKFLGTGKTTPNTLVYGELGRYPLYIDSTLRAVNYWFKIKGMMSNRIPKQAYEKELLEVSKTPNWALDIKHCLELYGFSEVWINGGVGDEKTFLSVFRQRMVDCYKQDWHSKLDESDRYITYRSFKSVHQPEKYLYDITISKFRKALTKIRLGINELRTNKRYTDTSAVTTCPFCSAEETEIHFLLMCPKYKSLRGKYIDKHYKDSSPVQLKTLLQNDNTAIMRDVAMFIHYSLRVREEQLQ